MKIILLLLFVVYVHASDPFEDELKCNFRICGAELLNFDHFSLSGVLRKLEMANFCIKNCTPPVVHEFFHSVIYAISRRVPGHCYGEECVEKNRFVALARCVQEKAWPLLQCSKRLVDLGQVVLEDLPDRQKRNYTCSIAVDTTQCAEEVLQTCGPKPFSLVKEIAGDIIKLGISAYCHKSNRNDFFVDKITTKRPDFQERMKHFTDISPAPGPRPYPQFVKGYRNARSPLDSSAASHAFSVVSVVVSVLFSKLLLSGV